MVNRTNFKPHKLSRVPVLQTILSLLLHYVTDTTWQQLLPVLIRVFISIGPNVQITAHFFGVEIILCSSERIVLHALKILSAMY